jgi:hypothetical protein
MFKLAPGSVLYEIAGDYDKVCAGLMNRIDERVESLRLYTPEMQIRQVY